MGFGKDLRVQFLKIVRFEFQLHGTNRNGNKNGARTESYFSYIRRGKVRWFGSVTGSTLLEKHDPVHLICEANEGHRPELSRSKFLFPTLDTSSYG